MSVAGLLSTEDLAELARSAEMASQAFDDSRKAMVAFGLAWNQSMEAAYREAHGGSLPGSTRTRRLRKKRRAALQRWQARAFELVFRQRAQNERLEWRSRVMRAGSEVAAYNQAIREQAASARAHLAEFRERWAARGGA